MSLPVPSLDDRQFQDIVDEAKRLIPQHSKEWTNHNLSDPGVALIEIFAWMTEMTLYRINQIPERLYVKFLELMGVKRFPAKPARVELTFWLSGVPDEPVLVPKGTPVATTGALDGDEVAFITESKLRLRQPLLQACLTGSAKEPTDRWDDLIYGKDPFPIFETLDPDEDEPPDAEEDDPADADGGDPPEADSASADLEDALYVGFGESLSDHVLELTIEAKARGWGIEPGSPPREWQAWTSRKDASGKKVLGWEKCPEYPSENDTGGLNQNGSEILRVPSGHARRTIDGHDGFWVRVVLLRPAEHGYRRTPVLSILYATTIGGSVWAQHSEEVGPEQLGVSDGSAGQSFFAAKVPILPRDKENETVEVVTSEGPEAWIEVNDFDSSAPRDKHFTWDSATGEIRFGPIIQYSDSKTPDNGGAPPNAYSEADSSGTTRRYPAASPNPMIEGVSDVTTRRHGAAPPDRAIVRVSGYRLGGGVRGNVGAMRLRRLLTTVPFIKAVENPEPAKGGVDAETIDNVKIRGPQYLRSGGRAVTAGDYELMALTATPEVARALCLPPKTAGGPVRLQLVPRIESRRDLSIDDWKLEEKLVDDVRKFVDKRRTIGSTVEIGRPYYRGVKVEATLKAHPGREEDSIEQAALDALYRFIDPLTGGSTGGGWPFGVDVKATAVAAVLAPLAGVDAVANVLVYEVDLLSLSVAKEPADLKAKPGSLFLSFQHEVKIE